MSKIKALTNLNSLKDAKELSRWLSSFANDVQRVVNGNLQFTSNFNIKIQTVTFDDADVEQAIDHGLGVVPQHYIKMNANIAANIYDGDSEWTDEVIYLKSGQAGATVDLMFF